MGIWRGLQRLDTRVNKGVNSRFLKPKYSPRSDAGREQFLSDLANMRNQGYLGYGEYTRAQMVELAREVTVLREQVNRLLADRQQAAERTK